MKANTLTTISDLLPGDIFCWACRGELIKFTKTANRPQLLNRNKYHCEAVPVDGLIPKPFHGKTEVVFIKRPKKAI